MIVGPHDVDISTLGSISLVNSNPRLVAENLVSRGFKDAHRIPERLATISGSRDSYATFCLWTWSIIQNSRVDSVVIAKREANIGGRDILLKTRQNTTIAPGAPSIKR